MPAPPAFREAPASEPRRPKVIYVMGAGRSGSTILGVALGNCDGVFFAGELNKWLARGGTPSLEDPSREQFWGGVREQLPHAAELFGGETSKLERSSALLDPRTWPTRRRLRARYRRVAEELYLAIAARAGTECIVDSSHYPLRARELQALDGIDLYVLLLVRDPQAVVASLARKDVPERSFGTVTANVYLMLTNLLSSWVFLRHPPERRLYVRHEHVLAEPERVLRQILELVGSDAPTPDLASLQTGVPLHGNRLARTGTVSLDRSAARAPARSRLTQVVQLPVAALLRCLRPSTRASRGCQS